MTSKYSSCTSCIELYVVNVDFGDECCSVEVVEVEVGERAGKEWVGGREDVGEIVTSASAPPSSVPLFQFYSSPVK